jgi:hypothetical protein
MLGGCAAPLEYEIAQHDARAVGLDADGDHDGALRERQAAERAREKLSWRADNDRDFLPPLTAF